jgi:hypothetical protein
MKKRFDYKNAILQQLASARQPLDVEKIRVACKIGNWNTALKHCLELQYEGRIQAVKSSKSWIFWIKSPNKRPLSQEIGLPKKRASNVS